MELICSVLRIDGQKCAGSLLHFVVPFLSTAGEILPPLLICGFREAIETLYISGDVSDAVVRPRGAMLVTYSLHCCIIRYTREK
jgi:hypothetical protein